MAAACLTWFSRRPLQISRGLPAYCGTGRCSTTTTRHVEASNVAKDSSKRGCWVPDPRTGIYFPEGHERVLDDIPYAATPTQTYWLRNVDGVDTTSQPHPHHPTQQQPYD